MANIVQVIATRDFRFGGTQEDRLVEEFVNVEAARQFARYCISDQWRKNKHEHPKDYAQVIEDGVVISNYFRQGITAPTI